MEGRRGEDRGLRGRRKKKQVQNLGNGVIYKSLHLASECGLTHCVQSELGSPAGAAFGGLSSPGAR